VHLIYVSYEPPNDLITSASLQIAQESSCRKLKNAVRR